jgi:hypothetical protein
MHYIGTLSVVLAVEYLVASFLSGILNAYNFRPLVMQSNQNLLSRFFPFPIWKVHTFLKKPDVLMCVFVQLLLVILSIETFIGKIKSQVLPGWRKTS